jgi:CO dehydrogenase/acetyl-CoA synthase gamma subunit (corrinoid Fe-S protein)
MKKGSRTPAACPFLSDNKRRAFQLALRAKQVLPSVAALDLPRPASTGLVPINHADEDSLVLITGNSEFTLEVVTGMMAFTLSPFWLLIVDCRGDTVDMAMVYQSLQPEKIRTSLQETPLYRNHRRMEVILPGFAAPLKQAFEVVTDWRIRVGPICIAELPLYLGDEWELPAGLELG